MDKLKLTLNPSGDDYQYLIHPVQDMRVRMEKPTTSVSIPGKGYSSNILMQVEGQTLVRDIEFAAHNDGTDRANGTAPQDGTFTDTSGDGTEDVVTVEEQIIWLRDYLFAAALDDSWELNDETGDLFTDETVTIEELNFSEINLEEERWTMFRLTVPVGSTI